MRLFENYLVVILPVRVKVNAALSLKPASLDLIAKVPVTLSVPVAPAYFPVPPVIVALPVIVIVVGAAPSAAHALADESNATFKVFPPPLRTQIGRAHV